MIIKIEDSPLKMKKYRVFMDNGKHYDFGLRGSKTFLDHGDIIKRENYKKRHLANDTEKQLIKNLIPSPSLFSYYLLWGNSSDLQKNIEFLNNLWKIKHKQK
jgi:hypothetical protein